MKQRHNWLWFFTLHFSLFAVPLFLLIPFSSLVTCHSSLTLAGPDPGFVPVTESSSDAADVWVDNQVNGFGTYFGGVGSNGLPVGSGDPLRPDHLHRVYARVHNFGDAPARNLTITFYIQQPAVFGDGGNWQLIGTLERFGPIQPRSFRDGFVQWVPVTDTPASIKVVIEPLAGEASTANNSVIEGNFFLLTEGTPAEFDLVFHNPSQTTSVDVQFQAEVTTPQSKTVQGLSDWEVTFTPESRHVRAGGSCTVHVFVVPPFPCDVPPPTPAGISADISITATLIGLLSPAVQRVRAAALSRIISPVRIACSPETTDVGTPVNMTGQLYGLLCPDYTIIRPLALPNQRIFVRITSPTSRKLDALTITNTNGAFSHFFTPDEPGTWEVSASWIGDRIHVGGTSTPCFIQVTGATCPPPTITCPADVTLAAGADCTATFNQMATATSQCASPVTITSDPSLPATFDGPGEYTVTYTATDSMGQTSTCTTTVTVVDTTPPTITCPANITESCANSDGAVVEFTATASDNCDSSPTVTCTPPSGSLFPVGTMPVTCTATDESGNSSACSFTVTTVMNNPPTVNAGPDQSYVVTSFPAIIPLNGSGSDPDSGQTITCQWTQISGPTATINDPNACMSTVTVTTVGVYTFQLTVTDSCGVAVTDQVTIGVAEP